MVGFKLIVVNVHFTLNIHRLIAMWLFYFQNTKESILFSTFTSRQICSSFWQRNENRHPIPVSRPGWIKWIRIKTSGNNKVYWIVWKQIWIKSSFNKHMIHISFVSWKHMPFRYKMTWHPIRKYTAETWNSVRLTKFLIFCQADKMSVRNCMFGFWKCTLIQNETA